LCQEKKAFYLKETLVHITITQNLLLFNSQLKHLLNKESKQLVSKFYIISANNTGFFSSHQAEMFLHDVEGKRGKALEVLRLAEHVVEAEHRVRAHQSVQAGTRGSRDDRQMTHLECNNYQLTYISHVFLGFGRNQCCGSVNISLQKFQCCGSGMFMPADLNFSIPDPGSNPHPRV
jgi:hypothetical protein